MLRLVTLMPLGAVLLLCILWMMANLIKPQEHPAHETQTLVSIDFLRATPALEEQVEDKPNEKAVTEQQTRPTPPVPQAVSLPSMDLPAQKFDLTLPMRAIPELALISPSTLTELAYSEIPQVNNSGSQDNTLFSTDLMPLQQIHPVYPPKARRQSIEGWVKVGFVITTEGSVSNVRLIESTPPRIFDRAAIKAISRWKFSPQLIAGIPQQRKAEQKLVFGLN